jgi:hypothetical protein
MTTHSRKRRVTQASLLCALLISSSGLGREPAGSDVDEGVTIPHPTTILLRASAVHRELGLRPEQTNAVQAAVDEVDQPLWRLRDLPAEERNEPARRLLTQLDGAIATVLSGRQRTRLRRLLLQARGIRALVEPDVTDQVRLSIGQVERMREIITTLAQNLALLQKDGVTPSDMVQVRRLQDQAERNALALLDDRQRRLLATLVGRSFDFSQMRQVACRAPELRGVDAWINSDPVTLASLRGSVVVVHFYAFGCINCVRNLPHYVAWQKRFASWPVRIVGIHRPETQAERVIEAVREKATEAGMTHPIAVDNGSQNWDAWANRVWPSVYLIDKQGFVRYWWYGELNWQGAQGERYMRARIEELLREDN